MTCCQWGDDSRMTCMKAPHRCPVTEPESGCVTVMSRVPASQHRRSWCPGDRVAAGQAAAVARLGDWLPTPHLPGWQAHITGSLALRPHPEELPHPEPVQVRGESRLRGLTWRPGVIGAGAWCSWPARARLRGSSLCSGALSGPGPAWAPRAGVPPRLSQLSRRLGWQVRLCVFLAGGGQGLRVPVCVPSRCESSGWAPAGVFMDSGHAGRGRGLGIGWPPVLCLVSWAQRVRRSGGHSGLHSLDRSGGGAWSSP